MMSGECQLNMDAKGRMMVPVKFREEIGEIFVITKGLDNCLFVFPKEVWDDLEARINELPLAESRFIRRLLIGSKETLELDKQGRILVPATLRDHARLEKDVVFMGVGDRAEIWSKSEWEEYNYHNFVENSDMVAQKMAELGL
ncbi:MAG: division/cell wall cluster transcriptional repressor MraZ [Eubacteriales bacterium]|nr:division/cell wall cluster transcriptional repressor MraZ [Eubacteriales bacterium]